MLIWIRFAYELSLGLEFEKDRRFFFEQKRVSKIGNSQYFYAQ